MVGNAEQDTLSRYPDSRPCLPNTSAIFKLWMDWQHPVQSKEMHLEGVAAYSNPVNRISNCLGEVYPPHFLWLQSWGTLTFLSLSCSAAPPWSHQYCSLHSPAFLATIAAFLTVCSTSPVLRLLIGFLQLSRPGKEGRKGCIPKAWWSGLAFSVRNSDISANHQMAP